MKRVHVMDGLIALYLKAPLTLKQPLDFWLPLPSLGIWRVRDRERKKSEGVRIRNEIISFSPPDSSHPFFCSSQELDDPKRAKKQQEAAERDAQRLIKNFKEIQKKADKKSKNKEKDIEQAIKKMEVGG